MTARQSKEALRLRAHHIICTLPLKVGFDGRPQDFQEIENRLKDILLTRPEAEIILIEGSDMVCRKCHYYTENGCASPDGDESAALKWDAILAKELGVSYEKSMKVKEWRALIKEKSPFRVCSRCQWRKQCDIGTMAPRQP